MNFVCSHCGQEHNLDELSLGFPAPDLWNLLAPEERAASLLDRDRCVAKLAKGHPHYFIAGCLDLPVRETNQKFTWTVWVSLSERSFHEIDATWDAPTRTKLGPYTGFVGNRLPDYPETLSLQAKLLQREPGMRPLIVLESTDHPLAVQQREGIELADLRRSVESALHA